MTSESSQVAPFDCDNNGSALDLDAACLRTKYNNIVTRVGVMYKPFFIQRFCVNARNTDIDNN